MRSRCIDILRLSLLALLAGALASCAAKQKPATAVATPAAGPAVQELRGVWITNVDSDVLSSRAKIAEAMDFLRATGINVVYPVVWNKSVTLYPSDVMEKEFGVRMDPVYSGRDPLAEIIIEAHRNGIEVVPWFEYGFASSYKSGGGPILEARPQWAAIDQEGRLVTKNGFEWLNPLDPEVQNFLASLILEVATNYDVDGVQGDDRLPAMPTLGGYDRLTVGRYKLAFGREPPTDIMDKQWVQWRAEILNKFLADLHRQIKALNPHLIVSMSPSVYDWSLFEYLQDSKNWVDRGLVDTLHPQAYRYKVADYEALIDGMVGRQFTPEQMSMLYPGVLIKVGNYRIPTADLLACISYNRKKGVAGEVLFFYEGLRRDNGELAAALRSGPYRAPAVLPYREGNVWRPNGLVFPAPAAVASPPWSPIPGHDGFIATAATDDTLLTYHITVPATAVYDVYTQVAPITNATLGEAVYTVTASRSASALPIDQSGGTQGTWMALGSARFEEGGGNRILLRALPANAERTVVAGPIMLLLNRKQSPEVLWK